MNLDDYKTIGLFSVGLWNRKDEFKSVLGGEQIFLGFGAHLFQKQPEAILGWGLRGSTRKAQSYAKKNMIPFIAAEDGFLRSIRPGHVDYTRSIIFDDMGIYYAAKKTSRLELLIKKRINENCKKQGKLVRELLIENRLSKYNHAPEVDFSSKIGLGKSSAIVVVDQTFNDASVKHGLANEVSFISALKDALESSYPVVVKTHPDVIDGRKLGYLSPKTVEKILSKEDFSRIKFVTESVNPFSLFQIAKQFNVVTSQIGFEALGLGIKVKTFGFPFYAGWGLTDDTLSSSEIELIKARRRVCFNKASIDDLFAAAFIDYCTYVQHLSGKIRRSSFETTVNELIASRNAYLNSTGLRP